MRRRLFAAALVTACLPLPGSVCDRPLLLGGALPADGALLASLQPGDLVFREGTEGVSDLVRAADGVRAGWSHVALLTGSCADWQVVHAVPAELPGRIDGVVQDRLDFFMDRRLARRIGFYRVQATLQERETAVEFVRAQLGRPFRLQRIDGGTYCTELIWDAYASAGLALEAERSRLQLPMLAGDYLLPKGLSESRQLGLLGTA